MSNVRNILFRNFVFTLNNPTDEERTLFRSLISTRDNDRASRSIRYIVFQEEQGTEGTVHLQGYCELSTRRRFLWIRRNINCRMHIERRRGSQSQAIAYSQKEESRVEGGLAGEGGLRANSSREDRLQPLVELLQAGEELNDVEDEFPVQMTLHKDKIQDFAIRCKGTRNWPMQIEIFVGKTGTGKSYTAKQENPNAYYVPWPTGGRWWWPDYTGQHTVIMDEFRHQIKYDVMLKMMDRYSWSLESKGRSFQFVSHKIVITTNIHPKNWYPNLTRETKAPLARRINEFAQIRLFDDLREYPVFSYMTHVGDFTFDPATTEAPSHYTLPRDNSGGDLDINPNFDF